MIAPIEKYIWFINELIGGQRKSFAQLSRAYSRFIDSMGEYGELSDRTEREWKQKIRQIFGIDIRCDGYGNRYISNYEQLEQDSSANWMLQTLSMQAMIRSCESDEKVKGRILLESVPSGEKYLSAFISAIKTNEILNIHYHSFRENSPHRELKIKPLALKMFYRRWYVLTLSESEYGNYYGVYALDRIEQLSFSGNHFTLPNNFDAHSIFYKYYGVFINSDVEQQIVRLKVSASQSKYLRSLPLHHSQKEVERGDDYSVFEFFLPPTKDFELAILGLGAEAEVLEPKSFRATIAEQVSLMNAKYKRR